jgi:hypothetical protein
MAVGQMHDVASYAPAGYRLERTEYEGGRAIHNFVSDTGATLCWPISAHEDERTTLERYRAAFDAPVEVAATIPAPEPEPAKPSWPGKRSKR